MNDPKRLPPPPHHHGILPEPAQWSALDAVIRCGSGDVRPVQELLHAVAAECFECIAIRIAGLADDHQAAAAAYSVLLILGAPFYGPEYGAVLEVLPAIGPTARAVHGQLRDSGERGFAAGHRATITLFADYSYEQRHEALSGAHIVAAEGRRLAAGEHA